MTITETTTTQAFVDPICRMQVNPATAAGSLNQDGETYYFCSTSCLQKFIGPTEKETAGCCAGN